MSIADDIEFYAEGSCRHGKHLSQHCPDCVEEYYAQLDDDVLVYDDERDSYESARAHDDQLRAQEHVIERTYSKAFQGGVALFSLALALIGGTASAKLTHDEAQPIIAALQPLVPEGCALMRAFEDYTGSATCAGGYVVWVNGQDGTTDIPVAIGTRTVGPDASGKYWDWAIYD